MSYKTQPPTPLYLKKPNHLLSSFSNMSSSLTPKEISSKRLTMPFTNSMTPEPARKTNLNNSPDGRGTSLFRSPTKTDSPLFDGSAEDADKKSAIKFGKAMNIGKVTVEDKSEEMRERYTLARKYVRELKEATIYEDGEGRMYAKKKMLEEADKVIRIAENIFSTMNIRIKELQDIQSDSAMTIYPVDEKQELAMFYQMLAPEVCDFPYAFLAKLKIFLVTICGEVSLYSSSYNNVLEQKMRNGLFVIKDLQTPEEVRRYWYKIVAAHFVKADPAMYEEWKEYVRSENISAGLKKSEMKGEFEELMLILQCILRPQDLEKIGLPRTQQKMRLLKKMLKNFEPLCFDEGWWDMKYNDELYHK